MSLADPNLPRLEYAPAGPLAGPRRLVRRWLVSVLIVLALVAAAQFGPPMWRQAWYLRGQDKCMEFALPGGQMVYANQPVDATPLRAAGYKPVASVSGQALATVPGATMSAGYAFAPLAEVGEQTMGYYARFASGYVRQDVSSAPIRTGAFLHRRRNPRSEDRLLAIVFLERQEPLVLGRKLEINALVWRPATWEPGTRLQLAGLSTLVLPKLDQRRVQVFAGQPDPADTSHFTIGYDIDGQSGTIDGWLDPYDRVRLQVRDGPAQGEAKMSR